MKIFFQIILPLILLVPLGCSQTDNNFPIDQSKLNVEAIGEDFDIPWSFTFLPDGAMLVTEKEGKLYLLKNGIKTEVSGMPEVYVRGQGGLLDVILHPRYDENGWIYISFGTRENQKDGGNTTVMRAKLIQNELVNQEIIFRAMPDSKKGQHWGGRLAFDHDGFLFVSVGDRGARDRNPQSLDNHCGKIHRINEDGTIPGDNPFRNQSGAVESIYSYGHRNPQGMIVHPTTGRVWIHEHGPRGGDELNLIEKGKNYGWPVITYGINYSGTKITDITQKEGMEQPVVYWVPSIAPCGMAIVNSDKYPQWQGDLLIGSLRFRYIHRCKLDGETVTAQEKILEDFGRIRTIRQGPDGYIYFSAEGKGIFRIVPE